jgi:hypothetical protein
VFEIYEDLETALHSFAQPTPQSDAPPPSAT